MNIKSAVYDKFSGGKMSFKQRDEVIELIMEILNNPEEHGIYITDNEIMILEK